MYRYNAGPNRNKSLEVLYMEMIKVGESSVRGGVKAGVGRCKLNSVDP